MLTSERFLFRLKGIFVFILPMTLLTAQPIVLVGTVRSQATHTPVPYANVEVEGTDLGTATSPGGMFELKVPRLPIMLKVSHIGYADEEIEVSSTRIGTVFLKPTVLTGEEVLVTATRAVEGETPVAFSSMEGDDIDRNYSHQDVPMVLADLPGIYAYSDAGNGVGYTYLKIRGFSQDRIVVMLNGIPLNDPEAHAVYWVDHGDILASTGGIQVQRGVGNSLYGSSVFGGTVNLITDYQSAYPGFSFTSGYGDYLDAGGLNLPSQKVSAAYAGRPWKNNVTVYGRYSDLTSGGYRKGSGTHQRSVHAGVEINSSTSLTRFEAILGQEETAFSWEGIIPTYGYDLDDRADRRYNFYADPYFNGGRDDANKDVFSQSLLSFHHSEKLFGGLVSGTLSRVSGNGYYEQFKGSRDVEEYNLTSFVPETSEEVDLIRQKWLRNGYWGLVYQYSRPVPSGRVTVGGDARLYSSDHFGKVVEVDGLGNVPGDHRYYGDDTRKTSFSFYLHSTYRLTENLRAMADLRYLGHRYVFDQETMGAFTKGYGYKLKYDFLDSHLGLRYNVGKVFSVFANVSTAHREPADGDIYDHDDPEMTPAIQEFLEDSLLTRVDGYASPRTREEFLIDYEAGVSFRLSNLEGTVNLYRMDFRDELIPAAYRYYDADDLLKANAPRTIHRGMEGSLKIHLTDGLVFQQNLTLSDNRFVEFLGDSLGWAPWGGSGVTDYGGKVIPAYPDFQTNWKLLVTRGRVRPWIRIHRVGKQYIDFANTEEAALDPYTLVDIGGEVSLPRMVGAKPRVRFWINNVFDVLYETFGYNYHDGWPPERVDAYWPGATRNYFVTLTLEI
ncbi:MAG: TonB-dependent receptor [Fidelibacterota bacterium]